LKIASEKSIVMSQLLIFFSIKIAEIKKGCIFAPRKWVEWFRKRYKS